MMKQILRSKTPASFSQWSTSLGHELHANGAVDTLSEAHRNIAVVGDDDVIDLDGGAEFKIFWVSQNDVRIAGSSGSTQLPFSEDMSRQCRHRRQQTHHGKVLRPGSAIRQCRAVRRQRKGGMDEVVRELRSLRDQGYAGGTASASHRSNSQGGLMEGLAPRRHSATSSPARRSLIARRRRTCSRTSAPVCILRR